MKRVSFNLQANRYHAAAVNKKEDLLLSEAEIEAYWYSQDELRSMQNEDAERFYNAIDGGASAWRENDDEEEEEYTFRGLEYRDPSVFYSAVASVLHEQDTQRKHGRSRPDMIANIYILSSSFCKRDALRLAHQDEIDARKILRSVRKSERLLL